MRMDTLFCSVVGACLLVSSTVMADVALNGQNATPEMIVRVAAGEAVKVDSKSLDKVARSYAVLLQGAKEGQEIYGLTVGVGWNKDRKTVDATGELTPELMEASREFNEGLLRAHSVGVGPDTALPVVRAAMAVRLNNILTGGPGVSPRCGDAHRVPEQGHHPDHALARLGRAGGYDTAQPYRSCHARRRRGRLSGPPDAGRGCPKDRGHRAAKAVRQGWPRDSQFQCLYRWSRSYGHS